MTVDPTFARAYTGLVFNYLGRSMDEGVGIPRELDLNLIEARRLAEQVLLVDPTEPRVQSTAGYVFLTWREFDRAGRYFALAQSMNPNDATLQMHWAWAQACLGRPERGLPATEIALRLNPRHPRWYGFYRLRVLFFLKRFDEVVELLAYRMTDNPTLHRRDMFLLAAAFGHLGRLEEARCCAAWFTEGVAQAWRGDPEAGPREYVEWFVDATLLKRVEDEELLRVGLQLAGLSV